MRRLSQKSNLSRIFDCSSRRYCESRIYVNMQSNLIDSNVALHMHLTLSLSSGHVKFAVWTGPKSKHFDITISFICAPQITDLKINVYMQMRYTRPLKHWSVSLRGDPEELRGWQQNAIFTSKPIYAWRIYTSCCLLYSSAQVQDDSPRTSAHQCLVTKINMTILHWIDNPIFKEQSFECIGNFSNKDVFTRN